MEQTTNEKVISPKVLWDTLRRCWIFVLIVALVTGGTVFLVKKLTYQKKYGALSSFIMITANPDTGNYSSGNYSMDLKRVTDVEYLMTKSLTATDIAIEKLKTIDGYTGPITRKAILNSFSMTTYESSRYVTIYATADTQENANTLAAVLVEVANTMVDNNLSDVDSFRIVDKGKPNGVSNRMFSSLDYALPFLAGLAVYVLFLLVALFDDRIRTPEDAQRCLSLNILGYLPDMDRAERHGLGYGHGEYGYTRPDAPKERKGDAEK